MLVAVVLNHVFTAVSDNSNTRVNQVSHDVKHCVLQIHDQSTIQIESHDRNHLNQPLFVSWGLAMIRR
jgi:hypothetical protein